MTDEQVDLLAQAIYGGFISDRPEPYLIDWSTLTPKNKGDFRRAARAAARAMDALPPPARTLALVDALKAAKAAMWLEARGSWTLADFKNWAVVQQIDAALTATDGVAR